MPDVNYFRLYIRLREGKCLTKRKIGIALLQWLLFERRQDILFFYTGLQNWSLWLYLFNFLKNSCSQLNEPANWRQFEAFYIRKHKPTSTQDRNAANSRAFCFNDRLSTMYNTSVQLIDSCFVWHSLIRLRYPHLTSLIILLYFIHVLHCIYTSHILHILRPFPHFFHILFHIYSCRSKTFLYPCWCRSS